MLGHRRERGVNVADWPIFLINLDKDDARLDSASAELSRAQLSWTRIPAVNGRNLPDEKVASVYDAKLNRRRARHPMTRPEIGCYLSHIEAWHKIAAMDAPGAVVLEDDFRVTGDLGATVSAISADQGDWDMTKLFSFRPGAKHRHPRPIANGVTLVEPYKIPSTTLGYALRKDAATRLLSLSAPFFRPVDEDLKFYWEKSLKIVLALPQVLEVGAQETAEGTVGESRGRAQSGDGRSAIGRAVAGLRYQLGYSLRLHRERFFE